MAEAEKVLPKPPGDSGLVQIVGRHLHLHAVADGEAHPALAHLSTDRREHQMLVVEFDAEHRAGQHRGDTAFHFDVLFFALFVHG